MSEQPDKCCGDSRRRGNLHFVMLLMVAIVAVSISTSVLISRSNETKRPTTPLTFWTCVQHPEIRKTEPGRCPVCGRVLVTVAEQPQPAVAE